MPAVFLPQPPYKPNTAAQTLSPQKPTVPTAPTPRIIIARAEGQRIEPNSVSAIISNLAAQHQPKPANAPYVALDDFLNKKFGSNVATPQQSQQQQQQLLQNS